MKRKAKYAAFLAVKKAFILLCAKKLLIIAVLKIEKTGKWKHQKIAGTLERSALINDKIDKWQHIKVISTENVKKIVIYIYQYMARH